ncbi:13443_t:CDS:1, partial [Dentiscutata heterogama]
PEASKNLAGVAPNNPSSNNPLTGNNTLVYKHVFASSSTLRGCVSVANVEIV